MAVYSLSSSDAMSHVLVMCAMEEEARYLRDRMDDCSEVPLTGAMRRTRGTIGGVTVDLVISGIGGVYATMATTAAILDQKPTAVFSCGCSGAHVRDLRMGDVVIASEVKPLDAIVLERSGKVRLAGKGEGESPELTCTLTRTQTRCAAPACGARCRTRKCRAGWRTPRCCKVLRQWRSR